MKFARLGPVGGERPVVVADGRGRPGRPGPPQLGERRAAAGLHYRGHDLQRVPPVWQLSQFVTVEAGDLVLMRTPERVALSGRFPHLHEGDVMELEAAGLGRHRTPFGSAEAAT